VKKVGRGRGLCFIKTTPDKIAAVPGPGEGHVEEPQVFRQDLLFSSGAVFVHFFRPEIESGSHVLGLVVEGEGLFRTLDPGTVPCKGAEHDRVFKTLALVDRYQFDGLFIALEPQQMLVREW